MKEGILQNHELKSGVCRSREKASAEPKTEGSLRRMVSYFVSHSSVCVCVDNGSEMAVRGQLVRISSLFNHMGSGNQTQVVKLGHKCLGHENFVIMRKISLGHKETEEGAET